jgi:hypothetical protein
LREFWTKIRIAGEDSGDCSGQALVGVGLENVTVGAQCPGLLEVRRARLDGKKDEFGRDTGGTELGSSFKAVHDGHADVGDDEVGLEALGRFYQGSTVFDPADDVMVRLQEALHLLEHGDVIICQENSFSALFGTRAPSR